ncbi:hypothetical protein JCM6882_005693 [Rhodosporidiobolus microsporus]
MANVRFNTPHLNHLASQTVDVLDDLFALLLAEAVQKNDQLPTKGTITRFHSKQPPPLEVGAYLARLTKYTPFPRDALLLAIVYLNRISHLPYKSEPSVHPAPLLPTISPWRLRGTRPSPPSPTSPLPPALGDPSTPSRPGASPPAISCSPSSLAVPTSPLSASSPIPPSPTISSVERPRSTPILNSYTLHRLLLAVLLVATKYTCDGTLSQPRVAKVGGVATSELCKLEGEAIRLLRWELGWSLHEMEETMKEVVRVGVEKGVLEPLPPQEPKGEEEEVLSERREEEPSPPPFIPSPSLSATYAFSFNTPPRPYIHNDPPPRRLAPITTNTSAASSVSGLSAPSSEYSASQPSSSASSPRLFSPPIAAGKGKGRGSYFTQVTPDEGDEEAEEEGEMTPPSSPSVAEGEGEEGEEKLEGKDLPRPRPPRGLSPKGSDETVRRLEGVTLEDGGEKKEEG